MGTLSAAQQKARAQDRDRGSGRFAWLCFFRLRRHVGEGPSTRRSRARPSTRLRIAHLCAATVATAATSALFVRAVFLRGAQAAGTAATARLFFCACTGAAARLPRPCHGCGAPVHCAVLPAAGRAWVPRHSGHGGTPRRLADAGWPHWKVFQFSSLIFGTRQMKRASGGGWGRGGGGAGGAWPRSCAVLPARGTVGSLGQRVGTDGHGGKGRSHAGELRRGELMCGKQLVRVAHASQCVEQVRAAFARFVEDERRGFEGGLVVVLGIDRAGAWSATAPRRVCGGRRALIARASTVVQGRLSARHLLVVDGWVGRCLLLCRLHGGSGRRLACRGLAGRASVGVVGLCARCAAAHLLGRPLLLVLLWTAARFVRFVFGRCLQHCLQARGLASTAGHRGTCRWWWSAVTVHPQLTP